MLGRKVIFEDTRDFKGFHSDGYIDSDGVIHLDIKTVDPINFVLKHELTHFGESSPLYKNFVAEVRKSKIFKKWINKKVPGNKSIPQKIGEYRDNIVRRYRNNGITLSQRKAQNELIANFVGEVLFTEDGSGLRSMISDMEVKERSKFVQFFRDFFEYIKKKLSGQKVTQEVVRLERMFNEVLRTVEGKVQEQFSISVDDSIVESFCIERINDYIHVQRKVFQMLQKEVNKSMVLHMHLISWIDLRLFC